jgi:hypothetical protein
LTWYLVCGCIMIRYRSRLRFVPVQWFLAKLWPLDFEIWPNILVWVCIIISYRSLWNSFRLNDFWPTCRRWALKFGQIFCCRHFISLLNQKKIQWLLKIMFNRYRTSYSYANVVDSWSYQDLFRQYCFLE